MKKTKLLSMCLAVGVFVLDQVTKASAPASTLNSGISFGLFATSIFSRFIGVGVLVLITAVTIKLFWRQWQQSQLVFGVFIGAVASNLLDRGMFGGVRDWLPIPYTGLLNNTADWCIVLSLFWVTAKLFQTKKELYVRSI